ncbi:hypothetical protein KM043_003360 [Ampulex compressa]|nr:hypothetical protein KM043_003360 [Ampulex compressa]
MLLLRSRSWDSGQVQAVRGNPRSVPQAAAILPTLSVSSRALQAASNRAISEEKRLSGQRAASSGHRRRPRATTGPRASIIRHRSAACRARHRSMDPRFPGATSPGIWRNATEVSEAEGFRAPKPLSQLADAIGDN